MLAGKPFGTSQVLRMLDDGRHAQPPAFAILESDDRPDAEMDELVALPSMTLHPLELQVRDAPRVLPVPDRCWTIVVGPPGSRPCRARR